MHLCGTYYVANPISLTMTCDNSRDNQRGNHRCEQHHSFIECYSKMQQHAQACMTHIDRPAECMKQANIFFSFHPNKHECKQTTAALFCSLAFESIWKMLFDYYCYRFNLVESDIWAGYSIEVLPPGGEVKSVHKSSLPGGELYWFHFFTCGESRLNSPQMANGITLDHNT